MSIVRISINNLAGVPSIVFGVFMGGSIGFATAWVLRHTVDFWHLLIEAKCAEVLVADARAQRHIDDALEKRLQRLAIAPTAGGSRSVLFLGTSSATRSLASVFPF